jgi:hypothetical protein
MMQSKFAATGAILYLLVFACAFVYPLFDHRTFAGLPAVLLNALIIYFLLAALSFLFSLLRRSRV